MTLPYLGTDTSRVVGTAKLLVRLVLHSALRFMPPEFRDHYVGRTRVVVRRGVNVEDLFLNYRIFAAAFDPCKPFKCVCKQYAGLPQEKGHVCCRADDPRWPKHIPSVCIHGKFVPVQSVQVAASDIMHQLVRLVYQFGDLAYSGAACNALWQATPVLNQLLQQVGKDAYASAPPYEECIEHFEAVQLQLQDLVCLQLDRNLHCLAFQCPRLFWECMMDLYIRDPHYKRVFISESQWLTGLKLTYHMHGWHKIASLYRDARACSAYFLPKNKDILKNRPIAPNRHHPFRSLFSISSRGLSFVLECTHFDHFNLSATTAMKAWMEQVNSQLHEQQPSCCPVSVFGHDVKQMFTELRHERTIAALMWVVDRAEQQHGGNVLAVKRRGRKGVRWGRHGNSRQYATVTLQQLVHIARYELEHTFVKVGCVFMWQQIGLAMGGFNSPPLAVITCAVYEYNWLCSLGADRRLVSGMRYVDDSTLVVAASAATTDRVVASYRSSCYGDGLVLEPTGDCSSGELEILECMVAVKNGRLAMRHRNRNAVALQTLHKRDGRLPFMKVVPYSSAVPLSSLCTNVVGLLHRLEMNTSKGDWLSILRALQQSKYELTHLGFPDMFLLRCLKRALPSLVKKDNRWVQVAACFAFCVNSRWRPWHSLRLG